MIAEIVRTPAGTYLQPDANSPKIGSDNDILLLLGYTYEAESNLLLLKAEQLADEFFELESGLAGAILLKLSNYRLKTAILVDFTLIESERFQELIYESNKGRELNFFGSEQEAVAWLLSA
jgi:hypothetical protein